MIMCWLKWWLRSRSPSETQAPVSWASQRHMPDYGPVGLWFWQALFPAFAAGGFMVHTCILEHKISFGHRRVGHPGCDCLAHRLPAAAQARKSSSGKKLERPTIIEKQGGGCPAVAQLRTKPHTLQSAG